MALATVAATSARPGVGGLVACVGVQEGSALRPGCSMRDEMRLMALCCDDLGDDRIEVQWGASVMLGDWWRVPRWVLHGVLG